MDTIRVIDNNPDNVWVTVTMNTEHLHAVFFYKFQGNYVTHNPSSIEQAISRVKNQIFRKIISTQSHYYMNTPDNVIREHINKYLEFKEV